MEGRHPVGLASSRRPRPQAAYGGGDDDEDFSGRCGAILSNGKRCPNAALPGSKYCGVPAHQALAGTEPADAPPVADTESAARTESPRCQSETAVRCSRTRRLPVVRSAARKRDEDADRAVVEERRRRSVERSPFAPARAAAARRRSTSSCGSRPSTAG